MSVPGHSLQGRPSGKSSHVRRDAESGSQFRTLAATLIMRYELNDFEWTAIKHRLPNKPCGVRPVNAPRVLKGTFWVLRSDTPCATCPRIMRHAQHATITSFVGEGWRLGRDHGCTDRTQLTMPECS